MADKKKLVILISGSGSNLQTFIDQCASGQLNAGIACVISNKASAFGLQRAQLAGIPTRVIDHKQFPDREQFDAALAETIENYNPDLVILAGFMRILTPVFVQKFLGRMINIHPSLLPKFTGLHTHQRAIDAGESHGGATVHFVTAELDGGPAIVQARVTIAANDTAESLATKVLVLEHRIFPLAARWFLENRLYLKNHTAFLDNQPLPPQGHLLETEET
jgi:phosphoribosylglycinamide formyltransferase-1